MSRRRRAVEKIWPLAQYIFDDLIVQTEDFRRWKYLIRIIGEDSHIYSRMRTHDEEAPEVKMLREVGIDKNKIFFSHPWFAVMTNESLVMIQMVLADRIITIYNIHSNKIYSK